MQKWEYLIVEGEYSELTPQYPLMVRFANYQELLDWKTGYPLITYANELGQQGWELVSVVKEGMEYIFKRPIDITARL